MLSPSARTRDAWGIEVLANGQPLWAVCKDLAEQGLVAINIGGAGEGKTKETGTEGSGGREGEQGGPTGSEGSNGCRPQRSRHSTGPAASEEANEQGGLGAPAATNLKCKDNKSAPLRAHQLRVGAFLSPACQAKSGALVLALVLARSATSIERGDQGGIDSKLRAAPERESICDDLDAAIIEALGVDVGVAHQNIAGNCSPSLSANTGSSTLEREPTRAQDARTGASSAVVTERDDRTAAATSCSVERQGQAKPAEQQSAENRRVQGELVGRRQGGEDPRGEQSTLGLKQGQGRRVKHCAEAAGGAIIDSTGSGPLPASHLCRPSPHLACHAETVAAPLGQLCVPLNVPKHGYTQNLRAGAAVGLSCLALRAPAQRAACTAAFVLRWFALLAFLAAQTFAASLVSLPLSGTANIDGDMPLLSDVLADSAEQPSLASRMP
ncbi:hypothetical protein AK812_SmicGene15482 [Symbiodinium microadriaticum]|uniref:Uncharacterized protein n=1 Tax=Symbiodinium microadriaticum TaxID=2951 RepID=A0A1Q9E2X1_SYMMI|nr:hypothetical protein AK812_SmicGene15482 [Symbiodinium microadriaticum]